MNEFDNLQIRKVDGGLLLIFRELLARGRAADVAQHLGLSPSAISHALVRLRDVFRDPLFIRRSHGLEPTRRAVELGPKVEAMIALIGATVTPEAAFDPGRSRRRFSLACPDNIASLIGDRLVESFRKEAPRATFMTRPVMYGRALAAIQRGEIDVALGAFGEMPPGLTADLLYEDTYCVIARQGHPVIQGSIDPMTYGLTGHVFVGNPEGALADEAPIDRDEEAAAYGTMPSPKLVRTHAYVTQWETAALMAARSDVIAECPRRLALRLAGPLGLQVIDPPFEPFRIIVSAVRREAPDDGVDWFLEKLAEAVV